MTFLCNSSGNLIKKVKYGSKLDINWREVYIHDFQGNLIEDNFCTTNQKS